MNTCVAAQGTCASVGSDGRACAAAPEREWSWDENFCLDAEGKVDRQSSLSVCERIGQDGEVCGATLGCRWEWDMFACVDDNVDEYGDSKNTKVDKGRSKVNKRSKGDRSTTECGSAKNGTSKAVGTSSPCASLNRRQCPKNSACVLEG